MRRIRKWKEEGNALGEGNLKEVTEAVLDVQCRGGEACLAEVRRQKRPSSSGLPVVQSAKPLRAPAHSPGSQAGRGSPSHFPGEETSTGSEGSSGRRSRGHRFGVCSLVRS